MSELFSAQAHNRSFKRFESGMGVWMEGQDNAASIAHDQIRNVRPEATGDPGDFPVHTSEGKFFPSSTSHSSPAVRAAVSQFPAPVYRTEEERLRLVSTAMSMPCPDLSRSVLRSEGAATAISYEDRDLLSPDNRTGNCDDVLRAILSAPAKAVEAVRQTISSVADSAAGAASVMGATAESVIAPHLGAPEPDPTGVSVSTDRAAADSGPVDQVKAARVGRMYRRDAVVRDVVPEELEVTSDQVTISGTAVPQVVFAHQVGPVDTVVQSNAALNPDNGRVTPVRARGARRLLEVLSRRRRTETVSAQNSAESLSVTAADQDVVAAAASAAAAAATATSVDAVPAGTRDKDSAKNDVLASFDANADYRVYEKALSERLAAVTSKALADASSALSSFFAMGTMGWFDDDEARVYSEAEDKERKGLEQIEAHREQLLRLADPAAPLPAKRADRQKTQANGIRSQDQASSAQTDIGTMLDSENSHSACIAAENCAGTRQGDVQVALCDLMAVNLKMDEDQNRFFMKAIIGKNDLNSRTPESGAAEFMAPDAFDAWIKNNLPSSSDAVVPASGAVDQSSDKYATPGTQLSDANMEAAAVDTGLTSTRRRVGSYFYNDEKLMGQLQHAQRNHQVAAILAYGMFRQWLQRRQAAFKRPDDMVQESSETVFYYTAMPLIETMIFAMRADGRIESDEHQSLLEFCSAVFNNQIRNIRGEIDRMLTIDLDPESLARKIRFPEEGIDMYLLSAVMLDGNHMLEQSYLESLSACLGIDPTLRHQLNEQAHELVLNQGKNLQDSLDMEQALSSGRMADHLQAHSAAGVAAMYPCDTMHAAAAEDSSPLVDGRPGS